MRLVGGGERQSFDEITPRLIKRRINDDRASEIPVVTSCRGVPLTGFMTSKSTSEQQFIIAKNDSMIKPDQYKRENCVKLIKFRVEIFSIQT